MRRAIPLTQAEARKAVAWAKKALSIVDWYIQVHLDAEPLDWTSEECRSGISSGCVRIHVQGKYANIWISNSRSERDSLDPIETLFHEIMHVVAEDVGLGSKQDTLHVEHLWDKLSEIMAATYRAHIKSLGATRGRKKGK